ncbi:MAG: hypothetical protein QMD85_05325, partial [Candidatus Aenigmarchaeota archaeon]|nr:hypothetical protein [Candidatus Aenigmarchaeota archaeon]MDI6722988.1 hypothetical protein [Candidatus Aenigmarchaeota archaeon]
NKQNIIQLLPIYLTHKHVHILLWINYIERVSMVVGYGKKIRQAVNEANKKARARYKCPSCSRIAVKRMANGVWQCRKCMTKFAAGAYEFGL